MKRRLVLLLVICMLTALCGCGNKAQSPDASVTVEGAGFSSLEEAAIGYAKALKSGDVKEIISTFAVETYVEKYDLQAMLETNNAYTISMEFAFESADAYTTGLNTINRQYQISKNLSNMYLTMGDFEEFYQPVSFSGDRYSSASELLDDLKIDNWMEQLAEMEIGRVLTVQDFPEISSNENTMEGMERTRANLKKYMGCDELIFLAVEVLIDGTEYYLCVDVANYGGKWYNVRPMGMICVMLGGDTMCGGLIPRDY